MLASPSMRAALDGRAGAAPQIARAQPVEWLVCAAAGVLLVAALFEGGGSSDHTLVWIGAGAVLAAAAGIVAVLTGRLPQPQLGAAGWSAVGLALAWVLWSGISITWSIAPDASWSAFNRGVAYLALLGLGILIGAALERAPRVVAAGLAGALALVLLWALAGKVIPDLGPDNERSARLRSPVGYWNALALVLAVSLPLWLWLAARRGHSAWVRAAAAALLVLTLVAIALTTSRGGVLVGAVAIVAWLWLGGPRLESVVTLFLVAPAAIVLAWWALQQPGIAQAGAAPAQLSHDGARLGVVLVVVAALVFVIAFGAARWEEREPLDAERRVRIGRIAYLAAGLAALLALAIGIARVGDPVGWAGDRIDEFRNPPGRQVPVGPERITQFSSNNRWIWWREAGRIFADHPVLGTGASSFSLARRPLREDTQVPLAPHNIALQALSETGLVGALLLAGFVVASAVAVAGTLRRLRPHDRAAAAALAAGLVAYLAHSLIDIGWDYLAASAPFFLALGVLLSAGRPRTEAAGVRRPLLAIAAAAIAVTVVGSLGAPWLAERRVNSAYDAIEQGDLSGAAADAADAATLNPLSIEPLQVEALAHELERDLDGAEGLYVEAVDLQPDNPETWYELGRFQFQSRGDLGAALRYLDRSYALDAFGPSGPLLDKVRAAIARRTSA